MNLRSFLKRSAWVSTGLIFVPRGYSQVISGLSANSGNGAGGTVVTAASGSSTAFITGQTLGTQRNDFSAFVGMNVTFSGTVNVTDIGRWIISGQDANSHDLKITTGGTGATWV